VNGECFQNTACSTSPTLSTTLDISSLTTTTIYNPQNWTILSVIPNRETQQSIAIPASLITSIFNYGLNGTTSDGVTFIANAINFTESINDTYSELRILRGVLSVAIFRCPIEPNPRPTWRRTNHSIFRIKSLSNWCLAYHPRNILWSVCHDTYLVFMCCSVLLDFRSCVT